LKYDESYIYTNPREHDIFDTEGEPLCTIIIQLAGKVLTQKRTYPKLIDVLGEVGGCMEVVYSFSKVVLFLITDILYDISLVNNLFSFNISKKIIMIKNLKATKIENISSGKNYKEKNIEINPPIANMSSSRKSLNINMSNCLLSKDSTQNNIISRKKIGQGPLISRNVKLPKRKSYKSRTKIHKNTVISNFNIDERSEVRKISLGGKNSKTESNKKVYNNINTNDYNANNLDITEVKERNIETEKDKKCDIIIEKIRFNVLYTYFCFLCLRRKKNLQNELLDKGMKLVYQKLDIFNIFKKMYIFDNISEQNLTKIISN
jgi:hypothetical protein